MRRACRRIQYDAQRILPRTMRQARRQARVIREHGADADENRVARIAHLMHAQTCLLARNPARRPRMTCDLPVERHRCLERDEGALRRHPREKRSVLPPRFRRADARHNLDPRRLEHGDSAPRNKRIWITERHHDTRDPCGDHRLGTGARPPLMRTRLECHVERRTACQLPRHAQRMNLRVRLARRTMPTTRNDRPIAHDECPHERIRRRTPARKLRQMQSLAHIGFVRFVHSNPILFFAFLRSLSCAPEVNPSETIGKSARYAPADFFRSSAARLRNPQAF